MKAIQTEYKGYLFRSRLEARWAVFFDACGIKWEYEPEGLILSDGTHYLPDFYLPDFHCYLEVKRKGIKDTDEGDEALSKISNGHSTDSWAGLICFGDPMDDDLHIFCQETDDGGGGEYDDPVTIGFHPDTGEPYLFAYEDYRERSFFDSFSNFGLIPMLTTEYGKYDYDDFVTDRVRTARKIARQQDDREGLVMRYLDTMLPENWDAMEVYERRNYLQNPNDDTQPLGTIRRETVSNIEIWCECFGKLKEDIKPSDSYAISAIMTRIGSWEKTGTKKRLPIYGLQRIYTRKS